MKRSEQFIAQISPGSMTCAMVGHSSRLPWWLTINELMRPLVACLGTTEISKPGA